MKVNELIGKLKAIDPSIPVCGVVDIVDDNGVGYAAAYPIVSGTKTKNGIFLKGPKRKNGSILRLSDLKRAIKVQDLINVLQSVDKSQNIKLKSLRSNSYEDLDYAYVEKDDYGSVDCVMLTTNKAVCAK